MKKIVSVALKSPMILLAVLIALVIVSAAFVLKPKEFVDLVISIKNPVTPPLQGAPAVTADDSGTVIQGVNTGIQVINSSVQGGVTQQPASTSSPK